MSNFNDLKVFGSGIANEFHDSLMVHGVNFASGVPCGVIRHIIANLDNDELVDFVIANRESESVGIVAGAYLAGKIPVLFMQNSGLFAASNDIASLLLLYQIPVLMIISYRGCEGEDAPQHLVTGLATETLLSSFNIGYSFFEQSNIDALVSDAFEIMKQTSEPYAILFKRGWFYE